MVRSRDDIYRMAGICTRDTDFHRFPFLEPVDPLAAEP